MEILVKNKQIKKDYAIEFKDDHSGYDRIIEVLEANGAKTSAELKGNN